MNAYLADEGEVPVVVEHPPEGGQLGLGDGVVAAELPPQPRGHRQTQDVGAFCTLHSETALSHCHYVIIK